jgi:hypothetical protein
MKFTAETRFQISNDVVFRKLEEDSYMLIELEGDALYELKDIAGVVWSAIENKQTLGEIYELLGDLYDPFGQKETQEIEDFLKDLVERKILNVF